MMEKLNAGSYNHNHSNNGKRKSNESMGLGDSDALYQHMKEEDDLFKGSLQRRVWAV